MGLRGSAISFHSMLSSTSKPDPAQSSDLLVFLPIRLHVHCHYLTSRSFLRLGIQVFTLPPPPAVSQTGPLALELHIATEQSYDSYCTDWDHPMVKVLPDPIYVEVGLRRELMQATPGSGSAPLLGHPHASPQQEPERSILGNGCPYAGDNYQMQLVEADLGLQFPTNYQHFIIKIFAFNMSPGFSRQRTWSPQCCKTATSKLNPAVLNMRALACKGQCKGNTTRHNTPSPRQNSQPTMWEDFASAEVFP
uniref:ZP-C domain-containing protein n=1 Tax=Crocodylus porosus TaxID=8502 RepID=A0A7M4E301_CROPO